MATDPGVLIHPVRLRILGELSGRALTTRQLAVALADVPQATLYRHVGVLADAGVIEVIRQQAVNGAVERTYGVVAGAGRLSADDMAGHSADEHVLYFTTFCAALMDTFAAAMRRGDPDPLLAAGLSYRGAVVHLSDEERTQFADEMTALVTRMLAAEPAPERRPYTLASVVIPHGGTA